MRLLVPHRRSALLFLLASIVGAGTAQVRSQACSWPQPVFRMAQQQAPAPIERRAPAPSGQGLLPAGPAYSGARSGSGPHLSGPRTVPSGHLAEWMTEHNSLSPQQQQQALEREPGFHDLPQPTQQRMRDRLQQLDTMSPEKRGRLLAHNEAMERLSPDQRAQVRGAMQQLGSLPPDQRGTVARTFRQLRDLPPEQRFAALDSDRYRGQFNDTQRITLNNLLRVEPMLPPKAAPPR